MKPPALIPSREVEREAWERELAALLAPAPTKPRSRAARPLPALISELAATLDLERRFELQLATLYVREPLRATLLVERVIRDTRAGQLDSPEGFLAWRLKELSAGT